MNAKEILDKLAQTGNLRHLPADRRSSGMLDFSTNDYMGLAVDCERCWRHYDELNLYNTQLFTSSASRLLSSSQYIYEHLEDLLARQYKRPALVFNSGWHVNTGLIPALCDKKTLIVADRLVHASIIDGMMLAGCEWTRFRHNDVAHLEQILEKRCPTGENTLVVVESIYSMDGDSAPIEELIEVKRRHPGIMLYIDEAHAYGVVGENGLGLAHSSSEPSAWDVIVGTLGKAAASMGAFAIMSQELKDLAINKARSFIFSTALPPINVWWSCFMVDDLWKMDAERQHLASLAQYLAAGLESLTGEERYPSYIQPVIVGDAARAVELSRRLEEYDIKVLPIRTPTVPPGTERLRVSLSAAMSMDDIDRFVGALKEVWS